LRELGFAGHLTKPMRRRELLATLERVLEHEGQEFTQRLRAIVTRDLIVEEHHRRGRTVLLVEDNPTNQRVAQLFLERAGCDVLLAGNGAEALAMLEDRRADLVLMDVQMPVMDGLTATRRIRAGGRRIPVVGLTAHALAEQVEECRQAGMDEVIAKPLERERLEAVLEKYAPPVGVRTGRHVVRPAAAEQSAVQWPEVSLARFNEVTMGDAVLARGLVETFLASMGQCLQDLESGLARGEREGVQRAAHTMVGASANIGAAQLEKTAVAVETAAQRGDLGAARDLLAALQKRYAAARTALEKLI
jgi:polar amino acid transport system substrate-binding protein